MIDIRNKEIRKSLIAKYLDAETSFAEERMLVDYFLSHKDVDEDEQAFVKMIRMENIQTNLLSDKGVEEYDRIVSETKQESKRIPLRRMIWVGGIAASIALFFMLSPVFTSPKANTMEITQCIQQVINLPMDEIASITATPVNDYVWVKAELKDGTTKTFIMSENKGTTSLLAIN